LEEVRALVPKDDCGNLTSLGSTMHLTSKCKPCVEFALKAAGQVEGEPPRLGCRHGIHCRYCHFPHILNRAQKRGRPSKGQRGDYKDFRELVKRQIAEDPLGFDLDRLELPDWLSRNHTLLLKFQKGMKAECESVRAAALRAGAERKRIIMSL
jgi:hypothetical protein